jgi:hypothetical protein
VDQDAGCAVGLMFYASLTLAGGVLEETLVEDNSKHELEQLQKDAKHLENLEAFYEDIGDYG